MSASSNSLFRVLRELSGEEFRSGEAIANRLSISRASVHNAVRQAQGLGVEVYSVRGRGYRLAHPHSWLDAEQVEAEAKDLGYRLHVHDQVDSTNSRLMALGQVGAAHKTVLAAEWQTGGKGRRGRTWLSPLGGGLAFSALWRFNRTASDLSCLSLAVGLGLVRALRQLGLADAQLKWPNDVLHQDRKLAGILIELHGEALGPSMAVIGVGVNVRLPEALRSEIDQPVTDLLEGLGEAVDRNHLLIECLRQLDGVLSHYEEEGFAGLRSEWEANHAFHGREARMIAAQGESWRGRVAGIDEAGALLLDTETGQRRFYSGELSLRGVSA
ncbi:MAG: biotin--[acetyl-CoA-carboxylase] ligase [Hydrogenophilaceae bacterium]|nr:biotin--[acetyl-CoA-carboxylase] ligase [Hydrogenophilaceae bacterium]